MIAGVVAITADVAVLDCAAALGLKTSAGGLLRLIQPWLAGPLEGSGAAALWALLHAPGSGCPSFHMGFHVAVGLALAITYAAVAEPRLSEPAWAKGLICALAVWLVNAAVLLPLLHEGFAGLARTDLAGVSVFALAHTILFVLLAVMFDRLATGVRQETSRRRRR